MLSFDHQIEAITFDAGGTLLYPYPSVGAVYAHVMGRHGLRVDAAAVNAAFEAVWQRALTEPRHHAGDEKQWWHARVRLTLRELGVDAPATVFDPMFDELWVAFADPARWRLFDAALETLEALRDRGYRLAVLSNWDHRLRGLLAAMSISPYLEHQIISAEVGVEKPDAAIFRHAERCFGLPGSALLHVGDSRHHDFDGAREVGWHSALVAHGAPRQADRLSALPELLDILP